MNLKNLTNTKLNHREINKWCGVWKSFHNKSFEIDHVKDFTFHITIRNKNSELFDINKHGKGEFLSVNLIGVLKPKTNTIFVELGDSNFMDPSLELHLVKSVKRKRSFFRLKPLKAIFAVIKSGDFQDESDGGEKAYWAYPLLEYYKEK